MVRQDLPYRGCVLWTLRDLPSNVFVSIATIEHRWKSCINTHKQRLRKPTEWYVLGGRWVYELVLCPACQQIMLRRYYWHEAL